MSKICTSVEQSKILLKLGIDVKTANMYYMYRYWEIDENTIGNQSDASIGFDLDSYLGKDNGKTYHYIPAWSLSALLELMPKVESDGYEGYPILEHDDEGFALSSYVYNTNYYNEPIDAVFEIICWLKENNKI